MMTTLICILIMLTTLTPINLALTLTLMSIVMSMVIYSVSLSVFPTAMVLISFSSGTMIVFCYCAMMANYTKKSSNNTLLMLMAGAMLPWMMTSSTTLSMVDNINLMKNLSSSTMILTSMCVVILSMTCINKSMYKKEKPLKMSY